MGQIQSINSTHIGIYQKILAIQSQGQKAQMIKTVLSSPEHIHSAKQAGIYGYLLHYIQVIEAGGAAPLLPGEQKQVEQKQVEQRQVEQKQIQSKQQQQKIISASEKGNEKAMNYFSACLRILELEEEVALTKESLKEAYKKAIVRSHPDKSKDRNPEVLKIKEKEFEAVTRAYAYLGEILRRIHGGREVEGKVEAPTALRGTREQEAERWKHVEPVALNPKKLDLNTFNKMFEQTRIPDPEESGYGDWLKGEDSKSTVAPKFSGKFNRDVFNSTFEDEAREKSRGTTNSIVVQEMSLASRMGYATELGRGAKEDYTIAPHEGKMTYTDLKKAYTEYNTFSQDTAGIKVENRSFDQLSSDRKAAPKPLHDDEVQALREAEQRALRAEEQRKLRMAQQSIAENDYFERMKRLVIRN